jgi:conjugative transfer signal peptidase TraF
MLTSEKKKRLAVLVASLSVVGALGAAASAGLGVMYNTEDCMPMGWYATTPVLGPLRVGETVVLCPPLDNPAIEFAMKRGWLLPQQRSFCPGNLTPYVKQVYALAGDRVTITLAGVQVNGKPILNTASLPTTANGHTPMPHVRLGSFVVPAGQVLLLATHAKNAFDGRYFGPVPQADVRRRAYKIGAT